MMLFMMRSMELKTSPHLDCRFIRDFFKSISPPRFVLRLELTVDTVELDVEFNFASNGTIFNWSHRDERMLVKDGGGPEILTLFISPLPPFFLSDGPKLKIVPFDAELNSTPNSIVSRVNSRRRGSLDSQILLGKLLTEAVIRGVNEIFAR